MNKSMRLHYKHFLANLLIFSIMMILSSYCFALTNSHINSRNQAVKNDINIEKNIGPLAKGQYMSPSKFARCEKNDKNCG